MAEILVRVDNSLEGTGKLSQQLTTLHIVEKWC